MSGLQETLLKKLAIEKGFGEKPKIQGKYTFSPHVYNKNIC